MQVFNYSFLIIKASDNGQVAYISVVYSLCVWILHSLFYVSLFVEMQVIKLYNRLCTRLCFYFLSGWTERRCRPITCASALQPKRASFCVCAWGGLSRRCVCVWRGGGVCEAQVPNQTGNTWTRAEPPSNSSPIVAAKRRNAIRPEIRWGGGVLSYARPGGGGLWKVWKEIRINLESPAVKGWIKLGLWSMLRCSYRLWCCLGSSRTRRSPGTQGTSSVFPADKLCDSSHERSTDAERNCFRRPAPALASLRFPPHVRWGWSLNSDFMKLACFFHSETFCKLAQLSQFSVPNNSAACQVLSGIFLSDELIISQKYFLCIQGAAWTC